jgi:cytochrome c2
MHWRRNTSQSAAALACALTTVVAAVGCSGGAPADRDYRTVEGGDPARGLRLIAQYQCGSCHAIPDAPGDGRLGPSLEGFGRRSYIAGRVPSNPASLQRWLQDPQALVPDTTMPDVGVSRDDARDIAAYLLALS